MRDLPPLLGWWNDYLHYAWSAVKTTHVPIISSERYQTEIFVVNHEQYKSEPIGAGERTLLLRQLSISQPLEREYYLSVLLHPLPP